MKTRAALLLLLAPLAFSAYACGGSTSTNGTDTTDSGTGGKDGSTADGGSITDGGGVDVFPADTTKIVVTDKGGFGPGILDGSTCRPDDTTYTLTLPARELTWKVCTQGDSGTDDYVTGMKTLSAADSAPIEAALHAITITTTQMCGADAPSEVLTVTGPAGDKVFYDDFYYCTEDGKTYVHGIGDVLAALNTAAH